MKINKWEILNTANLTQIGQNFTSVWYSQQKPARFEIVGCHTVLGQPGIMGYSREGYITPTLGLIKGIQNQNAVHPPACF